eukprot:COSAG02_NODE_4855_length_4899_cov_2.679167_3_plen_93_part_00
MVGNHEYYHGNGRDVRPWETFFHKALNFTTLHNSGIQFSGATSFPVRNCTKRTFAIKLDGKQSLDLLNIMGVHSCTETARGGVARMTIGWPS